MNNEKKWKKVAPPFPFTPYRKVIGIVLTGYSLKLFFAYTFAGVVQKKSILDQK